MKRPWQQRLLRYALRDGNPLRDLAYLVTMILAVCDPENWEQHFNIIEAEIAEGS